ncbi:hypothetical protein [Streptomyces sp. NBC_00199]|uniref:hypothetical protein n=1 Tax=Streptomyces sp. NBC_00199 TaxID=2975678 RepID=UPI00224F0CF4|nr:hypothetical protein [Streptomyces sp. NBC_00199]MCX5268404.1 hypothetical protein [Streptomyces sp. NBC_00199]
MASSTVPPAAVPRVLRPGPGRRVLHLALLVGGLFALGFLGGEQAQAADGAPSTRAAAAARTTIPRATAETVRSVAREVMVVVSSRPGTPREQASRTALAFLDRPARPAGSAPPAVQKPQRHPARAAHPASAVRAAGVALLGLGDLPGLDGLAGLADPVVAPARYGPPVDAPGVPGGVLGGAPRDADVHAVLPSQYLLPPCQASAPAARCDAAGTRDGRRDVRVFPG